MQQAVRLAGAHSLGSAGWSAGHIVVHALVRRRVGLEVEQMVPRLGKKHQAACFHRHSLGCDASREVSLLRIAIVVRKRARKEEVAARPDQKALDVLQPAVVEQTQTGQEERRAQAASASRREPPLPAVLRRRPAGRGPERHLVWSIFPPPDPLLRTVLPVARLFVPRMSSSACAGFRAARPAVRLPRRLRCCAERKPAAAHPAPAWSEKATIAGGGYSGECSIDTVKVALRECEGLEGEHLAACYATNGAL